MCVGRTAQAFGANARIDSLSKSLELYYADALAGKVRQTFAPSGLLHPADIHEEAQAFAVVGPLCPL
jgi:hypothetical protein